jgi:hypothetical protein
VTGKRTFAVGAAGALSLLIAVLSVRLILQQPVSIRGAVVIGGTDPAKELPIADVDVTASDGAPDQVVRTDAAGFFDIRVPRRLRRSAPVTLRFRHPDYQALDVPDATDGKLYVAHLTPLAQAARTPDQGPEVKISNVVVKYSTTDTNPLNIGSAVRTFQVTNHGDVPCKGRPPCSPDGKWKAATVSTSLDAGPGNEFHNARASCIAGPCPFAKIEDINLSPDRHTLRVTALDWSDTATFLLEAEVYKPVAYDVLRQSYPLIFDRALTFTLPAKADGVTIQAELDGTAVVFPLGPALLLSWANCQLVINQDQTRVYRCELRPGFGFS